MELSQWAQAGSPDSSHRKLRPPWVWPPGLMSGHRSVAIGRVTRDVIQRWPPCLQVKWRSRPTPDLVSQASALIKKDRLAGKSPQTTLQIKANRLVVIGQSV